MTTPTTDVAGIGASTAKLLSEHGISSADALAKAPVERLLGIPGFGPVRAERVLDAAAQAVGDARAEAVEATEKKTKKDKKNKKDKKRKDKDKKVKKSEGKSAKDNRSKGKRRKKSKRKKPKK